MVTVIAILMLLVCFNFLLKQTFGTWKEIAVYTMFIAVFTISTWPIAINQSRTHIAEWFASEPIMQNLAVILSVDILVQLLFCMVAAREKTKMPQAATFRQKIYYAILQRWPGFAIFPVVFAMLVECIFGLPGLSFSLIAYVLAAVFAVSIPLLTFLLRSFLGDRDVRLEMLFLSNLIVAMIAVVATVRISTPQNSNSPVNWFATAGVALLLALGVFLGALIHYIKVK